MPRPKARAKPLPTKAPLLGTVERTLIAPDGSVHRTIVPIFGPPEHESAPPAAPRWSLVTRSRPIRVAAG